MKLEDIARTAHETNREYCASLGDMTVPPWEFAPNDMREGVIDGVLFHLAGERSPASSHENWMRAKFAQGWVYGPVKDYNAKTHPCLVPYEKLPQEQRAKDYIFRAVVKQLGPLLEQEGEGVQAVSTELDKNTGMKDRRVFYRRREDRMNDSFAVPTMLKVTSEDVDASIKSIACHRLTDTLTVCVITLWTNYTVTGQSACVDPANYNEEIGQKLAIDDAKRKIWPLLGFMLSVDLVRAGVVEP